MVCRQKRIWRQGRSFMAVQTCTQGFCLDPSAFPAADEARFLESAVAMKIFLLLYVSLNLINGLSESCLLTFRQDCGCDGANVTPNVFTRELCISFCDWLRSNNNTVADECHPVIFNAETLFHQQLHNSHGSDEPCQQRITTATTLLVEWSKLNFKPPSPLDDNATLWYIALLVVGILTTSLMGAGWILRRQQQARNLDTFNVDHQPHTHAKRRNAITEWPGRRLTTRTNSFSLAKVDV